MNYATLASKASELIKKFGKAAFVRTVTAGTFDPILGTMVGEVRTDYPCNAVESYYTITERTNTLIEADDRKFLITRTATTADKFVVGNVVLKIVSIRPIQPGDTTIFWEVQARA